jgi:hypothetical protein
LNVSDNLLATPPTDATVLHNLFTQPYGCELRKGNVRHATGLGGAVETVLAHSGFAAPVSYCMTVTISATNTESGTVILVTFSEGVQIDTVTGWTFTKNGSPWAASSVDSTEDPTQWEFTMGSSAAAGNTLTIEYDGTGDMTDTDSLAACAIAETGITNTL